ncbi:MAG TPA: hypothetical protein DEG17_01505 [Cyanobacteria bacterium UBA11149]|nr:hypothetical protein [Cyanobacteria bacterium UBA11366]HBK63011.1 hypothetical protein [Cyanobacteria bacterium UBA11166]HBR72312.1 hypothetical protein [Cyanobacteria bacterium UBA11159]HBS70388.1 hypothetical protein [Cyanobacteria bacterium UBA11153]HBW87586.1 hypothetical protein [Cyanobacteria bacterium UBA11149]HCA97164.1 hypothetical protein [Cyanobacteria bacterium UBA9226]
MTLPNFLIIGSQKAGTTWIAKNLNQHPDIFLPKGEPHFFPKENFSKGLPWYEKYFQEAAREKAVGEKSTGYLCVTTSPEIPGNIYRSFPDIKLIAVLRNPVHRAISAFGHYLAGGEIPPFHHIDDLLVGNKQHLVEHLGLIEFGRYYHQLKWYFEIFDPSQIMVLILEDDIIRQPQRTLQRLCLFLDVDPFFQFQDLDKKQNKFRRSQFGLAMGYYLPHLRRLVHYMDLSVAHVMERYSWSAGITYKEVPNESTIQKLYDLYEEDNEKLFSLLRRKPPSWQNPATVYATAC